jgi:alpha-beta hydrolase superfamily lysophospholipase
LKHEDGTLTLTAGSKAVGAKLYWQKWLPDDKPKAIILLVHGYAEHAGRYQYFAEHCVGRGYAVFAMDHWGHGKSDGTPGFVPGFSVFRDGVDRLLAQATEDFSDLPVMLVGHSMGGLISATYLLTEQAEFAACVLSGPAIKAAEEPSAAFCPASFRSLGYSNSIRTGSAAIRKSLQTISRIHSSTMAKWVQDWLLKCWPI